MTREERDRKLIAFAHQALYRLRTDERWSADTLEALQASAFELGIAETKNNFFHVKKEFQS